MNRGVSIVIFFNQSNNSQFPLIVLQFLVKVWNLKLKFITCYCSSGIIEEEEEEPDLCSSNHFILDRIAEKDSTDNLFRAGSESRSDDATAGKSDKDLADIRQVNNSLQVFIDGPFGAPTNLIFHAQHAVLIGTGIGVTPFASILQSIMHR